MALEVAKRAQAILETDPDALPTDLAGLYAQRGQIESHLEHWGEDLQWTQRAVGLMEEAVAQDHPRIMFYRFHLAVALTHLGRHQEADVQATRALPAMEKHLGSNHGKFAHALLQIGIIEIAAERFDAARKHLERALPIALSQKANPRTIARIQWELAIALWHWEDERKRARAGCTANRTRIPRLTKAPPTPSSPPPPTTPRCI